MKQRITALLLAGLAAATPAYAAAPVAVSGDVAVKYQHDKADGEPSLSGGVYTLRLKGEADLGGGWGLYARLGAQYAAKPAQADYNLDAYGETEKSVAALDQFGLTYKNAQGEYKLGRQELGVGTTALLYSRADSNIGKHAFVDGLTASGKVGVTDLALAIACEDNAGGDDNKLYAIRGGFSPNERVNWGVTYGRYDGETSGGSNHWAVDGTYTQGKHSWTAELAKSNRSSDNKAYAASWNYGVNDKTAVFVTAFRVETNADMGQQSDFDNGNRGVHYGVTHQLSSADSLEVTYKDQKVISSGQNNASFEAVWTRSF